MRGRRRFFLIVLAVSLLPGCAGVISRALTEEAVPLQNFAELRRDTDAFVGKTVILGGEIIEIRNRPEATTLLVLEKPLGSDQRPRTRDASGGRFMVSFPEYLDPVVFAPGRRVTVAAVVGGAETHPVGEAPYRYVVLAGREIRLLPDPEVRNYPWDYYGPFYPSWYDPYWGRRPWGW